MLKKGWQEHSKLRIEQVLDGLSASDKETLLSSSSTNFYKKGEIIFKEGGMPSSVYYVKSGLVKKYKTTSTGREQIFFIISKGELMGYLASLGHDHYQYSACALIDSEVTLIPKRNFLKVILTSSSLSNRLLESAGREFVLLINLITTIATKSVRERIAFNLLLLDEKFRRSNHPEGSNIITLSRTDLANMVGTAKENLVRHLQVFSKAGMIVKTATTIQVVNRKEMMREAEQ